MAKDVYPVPPVFPIRRPFAVTEARPVPPLPTARVPTHEGVKVWMSPLDMMLRFIFVSDEVAKVCDDPV